eukprot:1144442-Pelagomonas_calceolata.AAC.2
MSKGSKNSGPVSFVWAGKSENTEKFMLAVRLWVLRNWPKSPPSRPSNSCKPPSWLKRGLVRVGTGPFCKATCLHVSKHVSIPCESCSSKCALSSHPHPHPHTYSCNTWAHFTTGVMLDKRWHLVSGPPLVRWKM